MILNCVIFMISYFASDDHSCFTIEIFSGGGVVAAAVKLAKDCSVQEEKEEKKTINILAVIADTGERYMSTPLFDGIPTGKTTHCWHD